MGNAFDIELRADDKVSAALKSIDDQVRALQPGLDKTTDGLKLGGQETQDGLSEVNQSFQMLGRFAKDNVQFIGDMVPPLRNFTGMAGKMGGVVGKMGLAGGAAYLAGKGVVALGGSLSDAASDAYGLQVAAQNAGMTVRDFSQLSGAMHLLGTDTEAARGSVEGLYKTFNDALQGRNSAALAVMNQVHAQIVKNADGTANVLGTVEKLADVFPKLTPQNQKTVADALGLNADQLQLLRAGAHFKDLLSKSDSVGLTVDPAVNQKLVELNRNLTEASASWDGLKQRAKQKITSAVLSDGSVNDGLKGISDVLDNGVNPISLGHAFGLNRGNDADMMRRALKDKAFQATLSSGELEDLLTGRMNDSERGKYQVRYGLSDRASQLKADMATASTPQGLPVQGSGNVNPSALSVVNNNPWNIRYAGQAGATPGSGGFARFGSQEAGVNAADRQLDLYYSGASKNVDHPLRTLAEIISKASPASDGNNTPLMIKNASKELGVDPNQSLDLSDTGMRSRVLAALFNQEGNNPLGASQIQSILQQKSNSLVAPGGTPPLVSAPLLPTAAAPAAPVPVSGGNSEALASALSAALKESGMKIELTLIDGKTGQRQTMSGSGSKVSTAMQFP